MLWARQASLLDTLGRLKLTAMCDVIVGLLDEAALREVSPARGRWRSVRGGGGGTARSGRIEMGLGIAKSPDVRTLEAF